MPQLPEKPRLIEPVESLRTLGIYAVVNAYA